MLRFTEISVDGVGAHDCAIEIDLQPPAVEEVVRPWDLIWAAHEVVHTCVAEIETGGRAKRIGSLVKEGDAAILRTLLIRFNTVCTENSQSPYRDQKIQKITTSPVRM